MRVFVLVFVAILSSCKHEVSENYIPAKGELTDHNYERYLLNLIKARENEDYFSEGLALANLNADSDEVKKSIMKGITKDSSDCYKILYWDSLKTNFEFEVNLVKNNKQNWGIFCAKCRSLISKEEFHRSRMKNSEEYKNKKERLKIDSTQFDHQLVGILDLVLERDQSIRSLSENEKQEKWDEQKKMDSLNLKTIDSIILSSGFPSYRKIGTDHILTIWLVAHHQTSLESRERYDSIFVSELENKNFGFGLLEVFRRRTENFR